MRGLHLVGMDHQHRLGLDLGLVRQQQVAVLQISLAAIGARIDANATMEHRARATIGKAAPGQFAAGATRGVGNAQARVEMALAVRHQHAARTERGGFAGQGDVEFMAGERRTEFQIEALVSGLSRQRGVRAQESAGARAVVLQAQVLERGVLTQRDGHPAVVEIGLVIAQLMLDQRQSSAARQRDGVMQVDGAVLAIKQVERDQMQRPVDDGADLDMRAVLGQFRIEAGEDVIACGMPGVGIGFDPDGRSAPTAMDDVESLRQIGDIREAGVKNPIDEDDARRRDAFDPTGMDFDRLRGREHAALERAQRRVFPRLRARAGQAGIEDRAGRRVVVAGEEGIEQRAHLTRPRERCDPSPRRSRVPPA